MALTRSPGPIPVLDVPPSEGNVAAVNRFFSRLGAGLAAQNQNSAVEAVGLATLGNTTGDSGYFSGSLAFAGSQNVTASISSGSNRVNTLIVQGPVLMSLGASTGGNTAGTTGLVASRVVLVGSQNVTLSESVNGQSATVTILGPANLMSAGMSTNGNTAGTTGYATHRLNLVGGDAITLSGSTDAGSMSITLVGRTDWASSNHSHGNPTLALTNITGTTASASNGLTLSLSGNAAQTVQTQNFIAAIVSGANGDGTYTSGTLSVKAGNNITLSTGANVFSIHGKTNVAESTHSHGNPTLALTNINGTTASASDGFTLSLSIGAGGAGDGGNILAAGTRTAHSTATVLWSNENGISFGLNAVTGSVMTASYTVPVSGTRALDVGSVNDAGTGSSMFAAYDHVHAGVAALAAGSNTGNSAGNTASKQGTWVVAASQNITASGSTGAAGVHTVWLSGPTLTQYLTTAALSNHSHGNPQLELTNLSGSTASNSAGFTLSLSAANPGAGGAQTISSWPMFEDPGVFNTAILHTGASGATGGSTQFTGSIRLYSVPFPWDLHLASLVLGVSAQATSAGTGSATCAAMIGIYTLNGNSALSLSKSYVHGHFMSQNSLTARTHRMWWGTNSNSNSTQVNGNSHTNFTGARNILLNGSNDTWAAAPGGFYIGVLVTQRSSSVNVYGYASMLCATGSQTTWGTFMGETSHGPGGFAGIVSTTTNTNSLFPGLLMPGSIHTSNITNTGGTSQHLDPYVIAYRRTTA